MRRTQAAACIAFSAVLGMVGCAPAPAGPEARENDAAMVVDGTAVPADEFRHCVSHVRAAVMDTAAKRGWVVDDADPVRGSPAGELLVDEAAEQCTDGVIRRQGAVALDLIDDASFASLIDRWKADNAARRAAARDGEVLYGPVEKSLEDYEFQEMADAESEQEKADASVLTGDPDALDAAARARPEAVEGLDMTVQDDRMVAAQIIATDQFEAAHERAVSGADITMDESWLSTQTIADLMVPAE